MISASLAMIIPTFFGVHAQEDPTTNQLYHLSMDQEVYEVAMKTFAQELDIWHVHLPQTKDFKMVELDVYTTESQVQKFKDAQDLFQIDPCTRTTTMDPLITITRDPINTSNQIIDSQFLTKACQQRTLGYLSSLNASTAYVDNGFFDCWRQASEIFEFFDVLVSENPQYLSKIENIATTVEGRTIPAYKISTGPSPDKKALYTHSLMHAREWQAGSTTFYTIAGLLDGLRAGDASITSIFKEYDWYFVPIVNLDGFLWTWKEERLWRKNRRINIGNNGLRTMGVDLNRNFGPLDFFNKDDQSLKSDSYPGKTPLSEPETLGVYTFLKSLPNLKGVMDIHSFSTGTVLRPFGNQETLMPEPFGSSLKELADQVTEEINASTKNDGTNSTEPPITYNSLRVQEFASLSYGSLIDSIFLEFNQTAAIAVELTGKSFILPENAIRPTGKSILQGLKAFAMGLEKYYSSTATSSTTS